MTMGHPGWIRVLCAAMGMLGAVVSAIDAHVMSGASDVRGSHIGPSPPTVLYEYSAVTDPGYLDVLGRADSSATVTVNSNTADRQGDYFREELSVSNTSGPVWQSASASDGTDTDYGSLLVADDSVAPTYDADGNLTFDGVYDYSWDGENRLVEIETTSAAESAGVPYRRVEYVYDYLSRRVQREEFDDDQSSTPVSATRYLYAGWRCLAEIDSSDDLVRSYTWGVGTDGAFHLEDSAGALLWVRDEAGGVTHLACSDRNGHVTALVSATTGARTAAYTYGPFGELLGMEGSYAESNPVRHASKFDEPVGDLVYYGYRYYQPAHGQWLSRDPIEEDGGLNLYGFVGNNPLTSYDRLGLGFWDTVKGVASEVGDDISVGAYAVGGILTLGAFSAASPYTTADEAFAAAAMWGDLNPWNFAKAAGLGAGFAVGGLYFERCIENVAAKENLPDGLEHLAANRSPTKKEVGNAALFGGITGPVGNRLLGPLQRRLSRASSGAVAPIRGADDVAFRLGKPVKPMPAYDWAVMSQQQRIASVVEKYGINVRGRKVVFDEGLGVGQFGKTAKADPWTLKVGQSALVSEEELAITIAHELRHSRAYLGSGLNTEAAAEASQEALRALIRGQR